MREIWQRKILVRPGDQVLDVAPKKNRKDRVRILLGSLVALALGSAAVFYSYTQVYKPYKWRADVDNALTWIEKEEPEEKRELDELTKIRRLEKIGRTFPYKRHFASYKDRSAAAISALELADHLGSPAARFFYGELLKDGGLLESGESTAQIQFAKGQKRLASTVQQGDARSILYYGLMLNAGYGIEANPASSVAALEIVMSELDRDDLHVLLSRMLENDVFTVPENNSRFLIRVAKTVLSKGGTIFYNDLDRICEGYNYREPIARCVAELKLASNKNEQKELKFVPLDPKAKVDPLPAKGASQQASTSTQGSSVDWTQFTPIERTIQQATRAPQGSKKYLTDAEVFGVKPASPVPAADKELQSYTGYVKGSYKGAQGGLSTFTVDNRQGGADAIARLYLNGSKPAVRSMYVRSGDTFKSESLSPGNYVLRYRFIGSEDTFEADRIMSLKQIESETGTQYSNVTVTLFKQVGGNLNIKKVPTDQF